MDKRIIKLEETITKLKAQLNDVSDKLTNEQQKSRQFENIVASLPGHIHWVDKEGVILGCNDEQARDVGCTSRLDVIGKTIHDIQPKDRADKILKNNNEIIKSGLPKTLEEIGNLANGDKKVYLSHKAPLKDDEGNIIGVLGISTDITAHKNNEFTLENIIALMPGNIFWKSKNGVFLGCNNNVARILKLKSPQDIVGKTNYDLFDSRLADQATEADNVAMRENKEYILEEIGLDIEGGLTTYLTRKVPLRDEDNKVIGLLGVSLDISDRKKAEEELKVAKEKAEIASQAKTEFMLNMQHDLRTPASGIYGLTKILAESAEDKTSKEYLTLIAVASKELLNVLNDILRFHQIESGSFSILSKKFDVHSLIEHIVKLELASAKNKKILLESHLDSNVPRMIISDEYRIHRLLLNLVSNAIKFTNEGSVKLSVQVAKQIDDRNITLQFIVKDTGIGIPKEKQNIIYEKFQKLTLSNTGRYKGLGLGLRIVKKFIEELGGNIEVESEVDKGTTFVCTLPVKLLLVSEDHK